jgi:hypothetical protein
MRKLREDSTWNRLSRERRETLEGWLFDENLGYEETLARVKEQFGLEATVSSLGRYYRRRARERQAGELVEAQASAAAVEALPIQTDVLRAAAIKLVAKAAVKLASERPGEVESLVSLTRLLLESEAVAIRRGRLALAEKWFDYEATAAAAGDLGKLRSYLKSLCEDTRLSHEAKLERVQGILFGWGGSKTGEPESSGD